MIRDFLVFEIRKNLDLRKILVTPKIFLKSRFHCSIGFQNLTFFPKYLQKCQLKFCSKMDIEKYIMSKRKYTLRKIHF